MFVESDALAASLIDSGSSVENSESTNVALSTSFSTVEVLAKTGTEPVTPLDEDENVLVGRAMTENLSKLSFPSLIIDKVAP